MNRCLKQDPVGSPISAIERAQYIEHEALLMDEMTETQLRRAGERFELLCEQRGWATGEPKVARKTLKAIEAVLIRATAAAEAIPDDAHGT